MKATITSVTNTTAEKKDKSGTYDCVELKFTTEKGELYTKNLASVFLDKQPDLQDKINRLEPGDFVDIKQSKNAKGFWNITDIVSLDGSAPVSAKSAPVHKHNESSSKPRTVIVNDRTQTSIQRQNALTNACNLAAATLGHNDEVDIATILDMARALLKIHEDK